MMFSRAVIFSIITAARQLFWRRETIKKKNHSLKTAAHNFKMAAENSVLNTDKFSKLTNRFVKYAQIMCIFVGRSFMQAK